MRPPDVTADSPWLTLREAAQYERRGARWLAREAKLGRVRHARVGGRNEMLFQRAWLDAHIESLSTPVVMPIRRPA
jgi:hypothetical protein